MDGEAPGYTDGEATDGETPHHGEAVGTHATDSAATDGEDPNGDAYRWWAFRPGSNREDWASKRGGWRKSRGGKRRKFFEQAFWVDHGPMHSWYQRPENRS